MALKFIFYKNGEIELVDKEGDKINRYIAHWNNRTDFNESLGEKN